MLFDFDKSNINKAGQAVLNQVLADAAKAGGVKISATGHADRAGSEDYNMALSLRRADSVREALIAARRLGRCDHGRGPWRKRAGGADGGWREGTGQPPRRYRPAVIPLQSGDVKAAPGNRRRAHLDPRVVAIPVRPTAGTSRSSSA